MKSLPPASIPGVVYILYDGSTERCKIGCSSKLDGSRQKQVSGGYSFPLLRVADFYVQDIKAEEKAAHVHFQKSCSHGEWFQTNVEDVLQYLFEQSNWERLETVHQSIVICYMAGIKLNNSNMIQRAVKASFA